MWAITTIIRSSCSTFRTSACLHFSTKMSKLGHYDKGRLLSSSFYIFRCETESRVWHHKMLPALVLLLVYNVCCTNAISFHPEQMDKHIGHNLLLQLVKRMDTKDAEIQELREIQKLQ